MGVPSTASLCLPRPTTATTSSTPTGVSVTLSRPAMLQQQTRLSLGKASPGEGQGERVLSLLPWNPAGKMIPRATLSLLSTPGTHTSHIHTNRYTPACVSTSASSGQQELLMVPFHTIGSHGSERFSHLPNFMHPGSNRANPTSHIPNRNSIASQQQKVAFVYK